MNEQIAVLLLEKAMDSPTTVDDLWQAAHGAPQDRHGLAACCRLDKACGGSGSPDSEIAIELSHEASRYLEFLLQPDAYPGRLRVRAATDFPPFGKSIAWEVPQGFRRDRGLLAWIDGCANKRVQAKLRPVGASPSLIVIQKPTATPLAYPWQQAVSAHQVLTVWDPTTMMPAFPRISSSYIRVGRTKSYQVCFRHGSLEYAKVPVPIEEGVEQVFEFQTPSLAAEGQLWDRFTSSLS